MPGKIVLQALKHVWLSLESCHLSMALMGGISLAVWEHIRATRDVDLLVQLEPGAVPRVLQVLQNADIRPQREPPALCLGPDQILQLHYEPPGSFVDVKIDLLFAESEYQRQALARRVPAEVEGLDIELFVLSCEDLIILKLIAGRIIDKADAAALLRTNRPNVDLAYLKTWIGRLALATEWSLIWEEAFPGEPFPE